jgi:hypothetical protein
MSATGETATWTGQGVGVFNSKGGIDFRGAVYCQSQTPKLSRLNPVAVIFEHSVDASGAVKTEAWEWK